MEEMSSNSAIKDHADVQFSPPKMLFSLLITSLVLDHFIPLPLSLGIIGIAIGIMLALDGVMLILWSANLFKKAGTAVPPNRPTKHIVTDGAYKFTRNPIYVGFILGHAAMALLFDTIWLALCLPIFFIYLDRYVIPREEAYLTRKFGQIYTGYCAKVKRWM